MKCVSTTHAYVGYVYEVCTYEVCIFEICIYVVHICSPWRHAMRNDATSRALTSSMARISTLIARLWVTP